METAQSDMEQIGSAYYLRHHALNLPPGVVRLDVGPLVGEHLVGVRLGLENVTAVLVVVGPYASLGRPVL